MHHVLYYKLVQLISEEQAINEDKLYNGLNIQYGLSNLNQICILVVVHQGFFIRFSGSGLLVAAVFCRFFFNVCFITMLLCTVYKKNFGACTHAHTVE